MADPVGRVPWLWVLALALSRGLRIRWRKPWGGPLVIWGRSPLCWGQLVIRTAQDPAWVRLGWVGQPGSRHDPGLTLSLPQVVSAYSGWRRRCRRMPLQIHAPQGSIQIGLSDPAQTGWIWGLLYCLPQGPLQIQLRFDQIGWRSRGQLRLHWRGVLWPLWLAWGISRR